MTCLSFSLRASNVLILFLFRSIHYLDANPEGHGGETREQRILEFIAANPDTYVAGLREATALLVKDDALELLGKRTMRLFKQSQKPVELAPGAAINYLLKV